MTTQWPVVSPKLVTVAFASISRTRTTPPERQLRSQKRMAEFLVKGALSLEYVCCIVAKSAEMRDNLQTTMNASDWNIPILSKPGCYF